MASEELNVIQIQLCPHIRSPRARLGFLSLSLLLRNCLSYLVSVSLETKLRDYPTSHAQRLPGTSRSPQDPG